MFSKEITTTAEDYRSLVSFTEFTLKKSNNIICIIAAAVAVAVLVTGLAGLIPLYVSGAVGAVCACVILVTALLVKKKADDGIKYGSAERKKDIQLRYTGSKGSRRQNRYRYQFFVEHDIQDIRNGKIFFHLFQV